MESSSTGQPPGTGPEPHTGRVHDTGSTATGPADFTPVGILTWLLVHSGTKVPGLANALLIFVLVLIVAAATALIASIPFAVFGILVAIFILPFASLFGTPSRRKKTHRELIFEATSLVLGIASVVLLFLSFFFNWPLPLRPILAPSLPEIPLPAPAEFSLQSPKLLDAWAVNHVSDPRSAQDEANAQKYYWFYQLGQTYNDNNSRDVFVIESDQPFPSNYEEFTRKLTLPELPEGEQPIGSGFIAYNNAADQSPVFVPLTFQRVEQRGEVALQFTVSGAKRGGKFLILAAVPKGTRVGPKAFQIVRDWAR